VDGESWDDHRKPDAPLTLSEERIGFGSGCRAVVRAASFAVADHRAGGVTLSTLVPDGFFQFIEGGGASATTMLGPGEARARCAALGRRCTS